MVLTKPSLADPTKSRAASAASTPSTTTDSTSEEIESYVLVTLENNADGKSTAEQVKDESIPRSATDGHDARKTTSYVENSGLPKLPDLALIFPALSLVYALITCGVTDFAGHQWIFTAVVTAICAWDYCTQPFEVDVKDGGSVSNTPTRTFIAYLTLLDCVLGFVCWPAFLRGDIGFAPAGICCAVALALTIVLCAYDRFANDDATLLCYAGIYIAVDALMDSLVDWAAFTRRVMDSVHPLVLCAVLIAVCALDYLTFPTNGFVFPAEGEKKLTISKETREKAKAAARKLLFCIGAFGLAFSSAVVFFYTLAIACGKKNPFVLVSLSRFVISSTLIFSLTVTAVCAFNVGFAPGSVAGDGEDQFTFSNKRGKKAKDFVRKFIPCVGILGLSTFLAVSGVDGLAHACGIQYAFNDPRTSAFMTTLALILSVSGAALLVYYIGLDAIGRLRDDLDLEVKDTAAGDAKKDKGIAGEVVSDILCAVPDLAGFVVLGMAFGWFTLSILLEACEDTNVDGFWVFATWLFAYAGAMGMVFYALP